MSASNLPAAPGFAREVRTTFMLALPLVLGHVSTGLIGFVDNVIAGHHSTDTLAAVTIGTALLWLPMLIPIGTLISLTASVSQLHGAGREDKIAPLFRQAIWLSLGLGAVMFAFLSLVPPLLPAFGIAPDIVPGATAFLHAVRWGGPALTLYFACATSAKACTGRCRPCCSVSAGCWCWGRSAMR
jgi:MATE family multidrug resistance protein